MCGNNANGKIITNKRYKITIEKRKISDNINSTTGQRMSDVKSRIKTVDKLKLR